MSLQGELQAYLQQLQAGRWRRRRALGRSIAEEGPSGDPGWAPLFLELQERCAWAQDHGELEEGTRSLGLLLRALSWRSQLGGCIEPTELLGPMAPPLRRYLWGSLQLRRPAHRPVVLVEGLMRYSTWAAELEPSDFIGLFDGPPGLAALRAALLVETAGRSEWVVLRRRWLVRLPLDDAELAALARRVAQAREAEPHLELASARRLRGEDPAPELLLALGRVSLKPEQARLLDRLAELESSPDRARAALLLDPDPARAVALARFRRSAGQPAISAEDPLYDQLFDHQRLLALLELCCGDLEIGAARLQAADPAEWSSAEHPGPLVLPLLLRRGLGTEALPEGGPLWRCWSGLDRLWEGSLRLTDELERALGPPSAAEARWARAVAHAEALRRLDTCAKARVGYEEAALLAAGWAEVELRAGDAAFAERWWSELPRRHPRLRGLRSALAAQVLPLRVP